MVNLEREGTGSTRQWFTGVVKKVVGNGQDSSFWKDPWVEGGALDSRFARLFSLSLENMGKVADIVSWQDGVCV